MTHSNIAFASLELQRFWGISKNDRNELRAKFGWRWGRCRPLRPSAPRASIGASARRPARPCRPRVPQPGPLVPPVPRPGPVGHVARLSETIVAFARLCLCGIETAIAFAGEKWAFLVHFSRAEVMPVSVVPCCGCAVVSLVSTSPCFCVLCAIFFALLGPMWARARKSSPSTRKMAHNGCFMARWASFFAEMRLKGPCGASFFADQQSWDPTGQVVLHRSSGSRARLLAVLTLLCAAKPHWWHGGQPAQVTTYRSSARIKGPACAGCVHRNRSGA